MVGALVAGSSGRHPGTMRIMPTSPPSRRLGPPWLEGRRRLFIGLTGLLLVLVAGTIGYVGFGLSLLDAVFQTVITVSTVGFGEARPFGSGEKVFTILLIFVGVATAASSAWALTPWSTGTWTAPSGGAGWNGGSAPCAAT
jgi:hypothetical protein